MAAAITILALVSLLVASFAFHGTAGASTRGLLQTSGSCNTYIPGCMPGRCSVKVVAGRQQSVCERCISSFTSSRDGLQCVCPPGRYYVPAAGGDAAACVKCGAAFFCKGGKETADNDNNAAEDLGLRQSCYKGEVNSNDNRTLVEAKGLTTKTEFAKKHNDCVPRPGWFLKGTTEALQEADLCPARTYSPGFGRIRRCLRCQSGTAESDLITFASLPAHVGTLQLRTDRFTVCQVPPGSYLVQNVVRPCPAGTFRSSFSRSTEESSKFCFSCPYGISTSVPRATNQTACNVVGPGINIDSQGLQAAQAAAADNAASGGGIGITLNATLCDYGFYFEGGVVPASGFTCKQCPDGTTTQKTGSTRINDCMVPPGYYIKTGTTTSMQLCPGNVTKDGYQTGYYRANWVYYNDSSVREAGDGSSVCTKCGDGILSTPTDSDESNGGNSSTALVAASSWSCYIEAGWGISVVGVNETTNLPIFRAEICAINSYGVENTTFGLQGAPCKPCQRNLVTLAPGASNASQCVNPAGVGYDPSGGEPCPQGYYAAAGSLLPCNRCPPGRTTNTSQVRITDCVVQEGHGVFDGDWVPASGLTPEELVNLTALPCPLGYFGAGGDVGSICSPCPDNKWTQQEGSTLAECSVCKPGYGRDVTTIPGTLQCPQCGIGLWSDGETPCTLCPSTNFIFTSSRRPNGREDSYNSTGHTLKLGATGQEECVPQTQQFGIDIGHVTINSSLYTPVTSPTVGSWGSSGPTVPQCISECPATQCCFVRFDYIFGNQGQGNGNAQTTCRQARLVANTVANSPWTGTQNLVFVKLVYAQAISAASVDTGEPNSGLITEAATGSDDEVKTKAMSSGLYSRCNMPAGWTDLSRVGVAIGPTSTVSDAATLQACKSRCDMMSTCWGFTVTGTGTRVCQLRSGEAQMNVRSFFANPNPTSFTAAFPSGLNWY